MAVFLTQNAPGLRTSPVKRGYWVVRRVLGEVIPPPPPVVPELPQRRGEAGSAAAGDAGEASRAIRRAPSCHARFDSFGLAFEGYGPVGETRTKDLAGRAVDTQATFPGGSQGAGLAGLQAYIRANREKDFLDNLSRKMLVYALGRSLLLSDEPLIQRMNSQAGGGRLSIQRAGRNHRDQPAVPEQANEPEIREQKGNELPNATTEVADRFPSYGPSRRRRHHGAAMARIAVRVRGHAVGRGVSRSASPCSSWATASTRITGAPKGSGDDDEARQEPVAARAVEEEDQRHQRPLQQALDRPGHPPRADRQPALRRADHSEGRSSTPASPSTR